MDDLLSSVKKLLIEACKLDLDPGQIDAEAALFGGGLGLDSLDALQLAVSVEEKFGVPVPDEASGKEAFRSAAALADYIRARKKSA